MAALLLRVPIEDGRPEFVEVLVDQRDVGDTVELAARDPGRDVAVAPYSLASAMDRVLPALNVILTRLRAAEHAPDQISIELGLAVGGETGLIFARGTAETTFQVTMTWRKPPPG